MIKNTNTRTQLPMNFGIVNHVTFLNSGIAGLKKGHIAYPKPNAPNMINIQANNFEREPITGKLSLTIKAPLIT